MKFENALPLLREGMKMKRGRWEHGHFTEFCNGCLYSEEDKTITHIAVQDAFATDWEIYEERMDFSKALLQMKAGCMVRLSFWDDTVQSIGIDRNGPTSAPRAWLISDEWIVDRKATRKLQESE